MDNPETSHIIELTAEVVAAFVSHNNVRRDELPQLIAEVQTALIRSAQAATPVEEPAREPAVAIRNSVKPDHIVCLEDGKKFKSLKRHLRTDHDMSPEEYRAKWGLKADYPMVAPSYAKARSDLAKAMGLGQKRPDQGAKPKAPAKRTRRAPAAADSAAG